MALPTLVSEFHGYDDAQPVFLVLNLSSGADTFIMADNHDDALHLTACEWEIEDYAFKTRGDNPTTETAYLHGKSVRANGTFDSLWTKQVPVRHTDAPRSGQTRTGYGSRIPSTAMVYFNGRWRRAYVRIYSNAGTAYILAPKGEVITVS